MQYREVPTKKFNDFTGTPGDFNNDFGNDYSIGVGGIQNFSIVTQTFQNKLCSLALRPCGCPDNTQANAQLIEDFCGCGHRFWGWFRGEHQQNLLFENINNNEKGEVKLSECGTKIYYVPSKTWHTQFHNPIPEFLQLIRQTNGFHISEAVSVPEYCIDLMKADIDYRSKRFNNKYSPTEKMDAKYRRNDEENKIIGFLNRISINKLSDVQDARIVW
jgi:hypothetical protein